MKEESDEKEEYIQQNIIEKGYDANAFKDFLISKKGELEDIFSLSLEEIQQEVQEFIEKQKLEENEKDTKEKEE